MTKIQDRNSLFIHKKGARAVPWEDIKMQKYSAINCIDSSKP